MEFTAEMQQEETVAASPKAKNTVGKSAQLFDLLAEGVSRFSQLSRITGYSNGTRLCCTDRLVDVLNPPQVFA